MLILLQCIKVYLFFVFFCVAAVTHGQDTDGTGPGQVDNEYQLEEIVVTAFNVSRRLLAMPGSLTMISPEQIRRKVLLR
jgi:hypothetical protein